MPFMEWRASLNVGIPPFDDQHKKLVSLLNELYDAMRAGQGRAVIGRILGSLVEYTRSHFSDEERYLQQQGYPDLPAHRTEHLELTRRVIGAQRRHQSQEVGTLNVDVLDFLKDWLVTHIQGSDQKYGAYVADKKRQ